MSKAQTNNSYLKDKTYLRKSFLPEGNGINVLNCFAGENVIWQYICRTNKNISVLNIDKKKYDNTLKGDNLKYLMSMDLNKYDVIDLDAYGVPYEQLKYIFETNYKGVVFITFIQSLLGTLPQQMLFDLGFTKAMFKKCKTLLSANGFERFCQWLSVYGVNKIYHISIKRKHYVCLKMRP